MVVGIELAKAKAVLLSTSTLQQSRRPIRSKRPFVLLYVWNTVGFSWTRHGASDFSTGGAPTRGPRLVLCATSRTPSTFLRRRSPAPSTSAVSGTCLSRSWSATGRPLGACGARSLLAGCSRSHPVHATRESDRATSARQVLRHRLDAGHVSAGGRRQGDRPAAGLDPAALATLVLLLVGDVGGARARAG